MTELLDRKHVSIRDLAVHMGLSEATVRRDLKALADLRQVDLVHGGATLPRDIDFSFYAKQDRNLDAKRTIGQLAATLVRDGDQLFLDSGTTCFEMAEPLAARRGLSVIVNSARLALELRTAGVIILGGQYRPDRMDTTGPIAVNTLEQLRGYRAFIGADGLAMDFGVSAADIESADLYRRAVNNARETTLLVDHSKFASSSLFKIVDFDRITRVVTDSQPPAEWIEFLQARKIEVLWPTATSSPEDAADAEETPAAAVPGEAQHV
jgi:DeoR family fructose operon transcriptional repressor